MTTALSVKRLTTCRESEEVTTACSVKSPGPSLKSRSGKTDKVTTACSVKTALVTTAISVKLAKSVVIVDNFHDPLGSGVEGKEKEKEKEKGKEKE